MTRSSPLLLASLLVAGCGQPGASAPDAAPAAPVDAAPDSGPALPDGPGLTGVLRDEAGQPLGGTRILACMATVCLFGATDLDGRFYFAIEPPAEIALKTPEDLSASPRLGATLCPVALNDGNLVNVGHVYVPTLPEGVPFGPVADDPQTLSAGDGLTLTLRRADLTPRLGDALVDAAARRIPPERTPWLSALGDEEIIAVYAIHPFGASSSSPIGVRVPSDLPAGTAVKFRSISEIDGLLSEAAPGRATGTAVETDPGAGISELSWLVISRQ